jgi:hypothetical protein
MGHIECCKCFYVSIHIAVTIFRVWEVTCLHFIVWLDFRYYFWMLVSSVTMRYEVLTAVKMSMSGHVATLFSETQVSTYK